MKIDKFRSFFTVLVLDSDQEISEKLTSEFVQAGYDAMAADSVNRAIDLAEETPPHFVLIRLGDKENASKKVIDQLKEMLPETHIFILLPQANLARSDELYRWGAYDCVLFPSPSELTLIRAVDRAAETDYYLYMNEQLQDRLNRLESDKKSPNIPVPGQKKSEGSVSSVSISQISESSKSGKSQSGITNAGFEEDEDFEIIDRLHQFQSWLHRMYRQRTLEEAIDHFFVGLREIGSNTQAVFLKFYAARRSLVVSQMLGFNQSEIKGIGVDLNKQKDDFRIRQLKDPGAIPAIKELVVAAFEDRPFFATSLMTSGEIFGVLLFFPQPGERNSFVDAALPVLQNYVSLLEMEKKLHITGDRDASTGMLNRRATLDLLGREVSRSRRTELPLSLLLVSLDQHGAILSDYGNEEAELILKMVYKVVEKNSRVNDVIGRLGGSDFVLALPNTPARGGAIKAERIRRIIESADFSKVVKHFGSLTVTIGVSEYPTMCRDAEELLQRADDALYKIKGKVKNKVCIAATPKNFIPDFVSQENI